MPELHGVLIVDKPSRMTSADVVARVKRLLGANRVGHTGTLDPMATGVLPIVVGEGTKIAAFLLAEDKAYDGELELGVTTTTLDADGAIVSDRRPVADVSERALASAMAEWLGTKSQIPPMYSAIRQDGQRLYELARKGVEVEREPREVRIDRFELVELASARSRFHVACSKGTYVRSLVRDVGERLGCGATLTALRRTLAGKFAIEQAVPLADLTPALAAEKLVSPADAVAHLLPVTLAADQVVLVKHGKPLPAPPDTPDGTSVRVMGPTGALLALCEVTAGRLKYLRVLNSGLTPTNA